VQLPRLAAEPRKSKQRWAVLIVIVVFAAAFWALGYVLGWRAAVPVKTQTLSSVSAERHALSKQAQKLQAKVEKLQADNIRLESTSKIDRESLSAIRGTLRQWQDKVNSLRGQVAFYKSIVSPSKGSGDLQVYSFNVRKAGSGPLYGFSLMLIQTRHHEYRVHGGVKILLKGMKEGHPITVAWKKVKVDADKGSRLGFSFHYFQELDGRFQLPEGFEPKDIEVRVIPRGRTKSVKQIYAWRELVAGGKAHVGQRQKKTARENQ
jgi:hypothetical protein